MTTNPDGTVTAEDQAVLDAAALKEKQETSKAKTYTEADVLKIKSDALSQAGRTSTVLDARETALKAREEAQVLRDKEKDEEDYEKVRGNPAALTEYQQKQTIRKAEKDLADREAAFEKTKLEHQVNVDAATTLALGQGITALAEKYKVDATVLKDLDLNLEQAEKVALRLTTLSPEALAKATNTTVQKKRDSGVTIGGGDTLGNLKPKEMLKEIDSQLRKNQ